MTEWERVQLGEFCDVRSGFAFKSKDWQDEGVPVVKIQNVRNGRVSLEGCAFVSEAVADSASGYELRYGDVLITMSGEIGAVGKVRSRNRLLLNQRVGCFKIHEPGLIDEDYFFAVLQVPSHKHWMEQVAYGAAQPNISPDLIKQLEIPLPPPPEQRAIGRFFEVIDDLIENNRRRIELLEETARLLYREWFVHFRYPGHEEVPLVDSELGPVPEGWGTTSLDQRACLTRSSITPGDYPSEMFDHFSLPAFDKKSEPAVESGESIKSNKYLVDGECVLWSKINPRFPRIWWAAPFITERRSVASTEFLVLTVNGGWRLPFIYSLVSSELFSLTMAARANGTSNSHQRVAPSDVMTYPILDPEDSIQERFSDLVEPFLQLKSELIIQNRSLAQTRDLLLPRLVSGDLDISDLELNLEAVG